MNACSSGVADDADNGPMPPAYLGEAAESLASAFIFGGAQGFIGTLWPVQDAGSGVFARTFYDHVLDGEPVGEALRATRGHLHRERPADVTWASFVLYDDPTYRLWRGPATAKPKQTVAPVPSTRGTGEMRRICPPGIGKPVRAQRGKATETEGGRLRSVVSALAVLILAGLLSAVGWWAYGRVSGNLAREGSATPIVLAAAAAKTATAAVTGTISSAVTKTLPPPTPTSTPPPTMSPTPQPTATKSAVAPMLRGRLAFVSKPRSELSTLYVMNADGSGFRELGSGVDPDWSPAGDRIAFAGLLEEQPGIHLVNPDGTGLARLTDGNDWQPTWSPDGKRIAFMSLRDINREIYVMNAGGSSLHDISNSPWEDKHPSWSPAGGKIAFISNRSGSWQVWVMNADGGNQVRLTDNDYDNFRPVWSPDGTQIAYGVWTGVRNEVWVMNADGSDPHMMTANAVYKQEFSGYGLAWAPNDFISFVSNRNGQPQVYAMDPDGSRQVAVTDMPPGAFSPAWSLK